MAAAGRLERDPPGGDGTILWRWQPGTADAEASGSGGVRPGWPAGPGLTLHHDGDPAALSARSGGGRIEIAAAGFAGSYVSLAVALPEGTGEPPGRHSILVLAFAAEAAEPPVVRLNLRCGVNLERPAGVTLPEGMAFDLGGLPPQPPESGWFDVIFPGRAELRVILAGIVVTHRLRPFF